ncbi:802_t:CDS:2 [Funneliformis caledonium]|uniref:802_t:CDS:1 n=1 Tax=Funneliformis caledonium TaxID=1117310 RepID=A0A9N9NGQ8_9GLOM|nr:802_t:CDS:2 [Funneliformis caledonium]
MFESLLNEYFDKTLYKEWSIVNVLRYVEPKTELSEYTINNTLKDDLYSLLQSLGGKCYANEYAKKKAKKLLSNYDKIFSSVAVKRFIDEIELKNEKKEFNVVIRRNVASASTLQALEEHRTARTEIENIRNANVKEATELVPLKRKSSYPHEDERKKTIVIDNDNEKYYESMWSSDPINEFFSSASGGASNLFSEIISDVHNDTSTNENEQVSSSTTNENGTVMIESPRQILPCILKSNENFTNSLEHDCIVKTFQNDVLKSVCSKEDWVQIRGKQLCLAEENLLERLKPIFQENENDKRSLLQKFARVWVDIGENEITIFEQYSLLVTHIFISEFESKRNIISHPSTTEAMWSTVELDSTALRKDGGRDILTLPKVSTGHKGDGTGLSDDGHESFVLEISFAPQNQDRRKTAEDLYKLLREMRDMLHTSKKKKRELGYKIPKDGLCVYGSQCYGYTQDLYEMEYIKPYYVVRKIGSMNFSNNSITKLPFILRMMWAFKERVTFANQVWDNLESRYEINGSLESSDEGDCYTKQTPKKRNN